MSKKLIYIVSAFICLLFAATGCANQPFMASMMGGGIPVESVILKATPVEEAGIYQSTLISRHSVSIEPQVDGQIADIFVKAGDHVKAGQLLMAIDMRKQQAALNSSKADAKSLQAAIAQSKDMLNSYRVQREGLISKMEFNQKQYNRYKALYNKKSVSQQDLEKYTDSYIQSKSDLNANAAQIQAQKSSILSAQSNYEKALSSIQEQSVELQYYKITAPYSGIIGDIPVKIGNYVKDSTELLSITQNDPLEINVGLPVDRVFDIHKGLPVEVLDNKSKVIGHSKISFISPNVSTDSQTVLIKAILSNSRGILKADQSVKVRVIYAKSQGILVPTGAISHLGGLDFAFLLQKKGGKSFARQQSVKLGDIQEDKYVVISGLKPGDNVIVQGIQKLMDGVPVTTMDKGK